MASTSLTSSNAITSRQAEFDRKQSNASTSQGFSHLRISNDDALCNNEDLIDEDDSYFDGYSHFKDDAGSNSQSVLIH